VGALRRSLDEGGRLEDLKRRLLRGKTLGRLIGENEEAADSSAEEPAEEGKD
jgi:hypothetical protein